MRLPLILTALLLTNCSVSCATTSQAGPFQLEPLPGHSHSFLVQHGWQCYTAAEVSHVMDRFLLSWNYEPRVEESFKHLTIIFTDSIDHKYLGLTYDGVVIFVRPNVRCELIERTALPHELLHVALRATTGSGDGQHLDARWRTFLPAFERSLANHGM